MRIPLVNMELDQPDRRALAWYAGLGTMATVGFIEWPVALVAAVGHALATHTHNPEAQGAAEGAEAGT